MKKFMCIAQAERHIIDQKLKGHASRRRAGALNCRCILTVFALLELILLEDVRCTLYWWYSFTGKMSCIALMRPN